MKPIINILIVDDEQLKLDLIREWVIDFNCHITYAASYASAIDKLSDNFDLIICDYFLNSEDKNNPGTGKLFKETYCKLHSDTMFILYSGCRDAIKDREDRADCMELTEETLKHIIFAKIALLSKPAGQSDGITRTSVESAPESAPIVKENSMTAKIKMLSFLPIVILAAGIIGSYSVAQYKIDTNSSTTITHCSEDKIYREKQALEERVYREKQAAKELQWVATLTELTTVQKEILRTLEDLKREVRKNN